MRTARRLLIFSCGLFTIGAQTLLFREFLTAFEGNDIGVGVFFGSWFLWVGLGAVLLRRWSRLADILLRHIEWLFLLYVPAFLGQLLLIVHVRELAGIASYDLMSVQTIVLWAMAVNAPVSLVTGALFPLSCRWIEQTDALPVSHVYLLDAVGSFAGGLAVTALLAGHVPTVRVFFLLALALLLAICAASLGNPLARAKPVFGTSLLLALLAGLGLLTGTDELLAAHLRAIKWSKLLPREALEGTFATAQAEYLYGRYGGQWIVMREGGVCEALPNEEDAGQTAAMALCQSPQAKRVLVIGAGLALCHRLLLLPQVEEVAWANADGEYAKWLLRHVPREFWAGDARFRPVQGDIRQSLDATEDSFDLVIVNLPEAASSAFNRYGTIEFYERVRASLREGGVVSVGIAGGENVMGDELIGIGASAWKTLGHVFPNLLLVPGERTWLIASSSRSLTGDPAVLRDRFAAIEGSPKVFPAAGLLSLYLPDRAAQVLHSYEKADLPPELLINRDARPLTHLYGLLLAARQSGASLTRLVRLLAVSGWVPFAVPILLFVVLRLWSVVGHRGGQRPSSFDSSFLIFSTGWVGIATMIILMYLYQTHFGSLYLHIGVISSLFMAGLTAGALVGGVCAAHRDPADGGEEGVRYTPAHFGPAAGRWHALLVYLLPAHALLLAATAFWFSRTGASWQFGHVVFAVAFVLSGLCGGGYWPIAAARLAREHFHSGEAGSRLETADHLGACLGGAATSLLAVPVLGTRISLLLLAGLLLANLPAVAASLWKREAAALATEGSRLRWAGCVLFALVACVVIGSNVLVHAGARLQPTLPEYAVRALAREKQARHAWATLKTGGKRVEYFVVTEAEERPAGYLFSSADFAPEVRGFGGRLNLAVHVDASGTLVDFLVVHSNETPSYFDLLRRWLDSLKGKSLLAREPFAGINAVAGATISSQAVLEALGTSAQRFAQETLGGPPPVDAKGTRRSWLKSLPDMMGLYLVGAFALAFAVAYRGKARSRIVTLALTLAIGGIALNAQYSSEQIATLLSLAAPAAGLTGAFVLVVGVPLAVLLFGNLYCGYVCPFGAAQELLGHLLPRRFRPRPPPDEMRRARFIKYIVLAVLIVAFFTSRDRRTLAGDPLTMVFSLRSAWPTWMFAVVGVAWAGSLFYVRFWCRYLCPAGAFLSLFNHVRLLRRWMPAPWFGQCEFGLSASDHLDCISCDRCRHRATPDVSASAGAGPRARTRPLVLAAALGAVLIASVSFHQFRRVMPLLLQEPVPAAATAGQPRDVDVQQIRNLIEQRRLSDRKADYYRQVE